MLFRSFLDRIDGTQSEWPALQGPHNLSNAAAAAAIAFYTETVDFVEISEGLRTYPGLPHRMEQVAEVSGVAYVNDSKGTNTAASAPALAAFENIHWIVGGLAKEPGLGECEPELPHVIAAYTIGKAGPAFAELLEGRREQFVTELMLQGESKRRARNEVDASIDRLIYYAGWSDKYQQIFSSVNPVNSSHFNFSVLEPTGVVSILAPDDSGLLGLVSNIAPVIVGGNTCIALASEKMPLCAVTFAEVVHASDVPAGVVNILTGFREELTEFFASHMDVNAVVYCDGDADVGRAIQDQAADNIKRVIERVDTDWAADASQNPYLIRQTQETNAACVSPVWFMII